MDERKHRKNPVKSNALMGVQLNPALNDTHTLSHTHTHTHIHTEREKRERESGDLSHVCAEKWKQKKTCFVAESFTEAETY